MDQVHLDAGTVWGALDEYYWRLTIGALLGVVNVLCVLGGSEDPPLSWSAAAHALEGSVRLGNGGVNGLAIGHATGAGGNGHQKAPTSSGGSGSMRMA